ncbi:hypothetical protein D3C71_2103830 [compost metagenome]
MLLGEIAQLDRCAQLNFAAIRLQLSGNQIKQGGFAAAVRTDYADPVLRYGDIGQIFNQGPPVHGFGQVLHFDDLSAQPCRSH